MAKTRSSKVSAPGAKFAEALLLLPRFTEAVRDISHSTTFTDADGVDFPRVSALMIGLETILERGAKETDADRIDFTEHEVRALMYLIDESIRGAARDAPLFEEVVGPGIDEIARLVWGFAPEHGAFMT